MSEQMEQETGQHIQEDNQAVEEQKHSNTRFGRPWSGWVGLNVVDNQRDINLTRVEHGYWLWVRTDGHLKFDGTGEPGAHIQVIFGPYNFQTNVDGAGNWSAWQVDIHNKALDYVEKLLDGVKIVQTKNGQTKERYFDFNYISTIMQVIADYP